MPVPARMSEAVIKEKKKKHNNKRKRDAIISYFPLTTLYSTPHLKARDTHGAFRGRVCSPCIMLSGLQDGSSPIPPPPLSLSPPSLISRTNFHIRPSPPPSLSTALPPHASPVSPHNFPLPEPRHGGNHSKWCQERRALGVPLWRCVCAVPRAGSTGHGAPPPHLLRRLQSAVVHP